MGGVVFRRGRRRWRWRRRRLLFLGEAVGDLTKAHLNVLFVPLCVGGHIVDDVVLQEKQSAHDPIVAPFVDEDGHVARAKDPREPISSIVVQRVGVDAVSDLEFYSAVIKIDTGAMLVVKGGAVSSIAVPNANVSSADLERQP